MHSNGPLLFSSIFDIVKIYYLLFLAILIGSCEKTKFPSEYSKYLLGTWELEWVAKNGSGPLLTPDDLGESKKFKFKKNARYIEFLDGMVALRGDYHIISEVQNRNVSLFIEHKEFKIIDVFFKEGGDKMEVIFVDEHNKYEVHRFKRVN